MQPDVLVASVKDGEEWQQVVRPAGQLTIATAGIFTAEYTRVDFGCLWTQTATESLGRMFQGTQATPRPALLFLLEPGTSTFVSGVEISGDQIGLLGGRNRELYHRTVGATNWAAMSLTSEEWSEFGAAILGRELIFSSYAPALEPSAPALDRLRRIFRSTVRLACEAPEILVRPEVARGLENTLIHAAVRCVAGNISDATTAHENHAKIMHRFAQLIEESGDEPLYLPEISRKLRVSDRTLRQCCHEYYGMGPKRYLLLRRLHLARRALMSSTVGQESVTGIATRFGFWELGRFSVTYNQLFGETPSATLRSPAQYACHRTSVIHSSAA